MSDADDIEAARRAIAWLARRAAAAGLKPAAARELLDVLYDYSAMMRAGGNASRAAEIADLGWPGALRQRRLIRAAARARRSEGGA